MAKFHPKPFGKYLLIDKLATGGMAEIYKAKVVGVEGFEKIMAVKRILPHCSADQEFVNMLVDEAKLSVLLSHTNIVQVYDLGKVGEDYFISMEFINGVNLREILTRLNEAKEKFSDELVVYIISEVCKGLDYAHSKKDEENKSLNIVHRDISPQNILISYEGEVKIVDFGIAKAAMNISHTMAGVLKGKISYMSPEQALGKPIDRKTDIFSTGLMLYELLTGEKLFRGDTQFEVLKKIRTTRLSEKNFPDNISDPVKKILAKALAYSVKDRYDTAGDMQIDLTRYLYTTYADFTPRKLANLMKKFFAKEIETKKAREQEEATVEPQTQSVMISAKKQQDIVHRQETGQQAMSGEVKQATQTFIEGFISGREAEAAPEPSITRAREAYHEPAEGEEEVTPTGEISEPAPPQAAPGTATPGKKKLGLGKILYPIAALLVIAVGAWTYFKTDLFKFEPPPPPEPEITGVIQIQSTPEGAQIFLNDGETNLLTPATLSNLPVGVAQKITLKKPKHREYSKIITLLDANPVAVQTTMEVIPVGSINITTTPPGAKIFLDGKGTDKVTPVALEDLPLSQTYTLRLEMEKHRPVEEKITLYSIEPVQFEKKLEEIKFGSVQITSTPPGAAIVLDNNSTGKSTPATIEELEVGKRYAFRLSRTGYQDVTRSVDVQTEGVIPIRETLKKVEEKPPEAQTAQDKMKEAEEKLKQLEKEKAAKQQEVATPKQEPAKTQEAKKEEPKKEEPKKEEPAKEDASATVAYVSLSSDPKGADVFINGVKKGSAPGKFQVTPGKPVEVSVSKGGGSVTKVVTLRPGETRSLGTLNLGGGGATGGGDAVVVIDSNPPGAMVLLNGAPQKTTPLRVKGLRPGQSITFTVKMDGYAPWSKTVTVNEGNQSFIANLKKL
jgi:serine/threonine protein kinase